MSSWESGKALPGALALKAIHENLGYSVNWILTGKQEDCKPDKQKIEAVFDPDLKRMIDILKWLMESDNQNLRGWAIIQFEKAFAEHCAADEKNNMRDPGVDKTNWREVAARLGIKGI